jgi:hypothetical protein
MFLLCPYARAFWKSLKEVFPLKMNKSELVNMQQWLFEFLSGQEMLGFDANNKKIISTQPRIAHGPIY